MLEPGEIRRRGDAPALLRAARTVCFDVDSTVCADEGIDVLAAFAGVGAQVAALTAGAMGGSMPFETALAVRLDLIRPSRDLIARCLAAHPPRLTPGIRGLVAALAANGAEVWLVSGGFTAMIEPVAAELAIPPRRIIANRLRFAADGAYRDFDPEVPTSRSGGKARALQAILDQGGARPLVMVGDGATDLEARPPADLFIGFGGVAERARVRDGADWYVRSFAPLAAALAPLPG